MLTSGQIVGSFTLIEALEETPICSSWRAGELIDGYLKRHVLAEFIQPSLREDPKFRRAYLARGQALTTIDHPGILKRWAALEKGEQLVSIYEYLEGFTLRRLIDRCREEGLPFATDHALIITSKILSALNHARAKHYVHGFIDPTVISVTSEGDVKLRDFALGKALRERSGSVSELDDLHRDYTTPHFEAGKDRRDVYAVGSILYEMLAGEPLDRERDTATLLTQTEMAYDGEQIPTPILNILISALDPTTPTAYPDIRKMNSDMEQLFLSGDFSPTTFNLAFFMHTVFRDEIDTLVEKTAKEKKHYFAITPIGSVAPPAVSVDVSKPEARSDMTVEHLDVKVPFQKGKGRSPWPMIIGSVAGVTLLTALAFVLMTKGATPETDLLAKERARLQQEAVASDMTAMRQQREDIQKQNRLLKEELRRLTKEEEERRKEELREEMARTDAEIKHIQNMEDQARRQAELEKKLVQLEKEKREAQKLAERERLRLERELQSKEKSEFADGQRRKKITPTKAIEKEQPQKTTNKPFDPVPSSDPPEMGSSSTGESTYEVVRDFDTVVRVGEPGVVPPRFVNRIPPQYPSRALQYKIEGYVIVEAVLQKNGEVGMVRVLRGLGKGKLGFEEAAVKAVKGWDFRPGKVDGKHDDVRMTIRIDFKL